MTLNLEVAERVYAFGGVPETISAQRGLLREAGYTHLSRNGRTPLERCPPEQIYAATVRVYDQARRVVEEHRRSMRINQARADWSCRLYEMFNIPDSERSGIDPADLEAQLLE